LGVWSGLGKDHWAHILDELEQGDFTGLGVEQRRQTGSISSDLVGIAV
jgi:hypothetical protein